MPRLGIRFNAEMPVDELSSELTRLQDYINTSNRQSAITKSTLNDLVAYAKTEFVRPFYDPRTYFNKQERLEHLALFEKIFEQADLDDLHFLHVVISELPKMSDSAKDLKNKLLPEAEHYKKILMVPFITDIQHAALGMGAFGISTGIYYNRSLPVLPFLITGLLLAFSESIVNLRISRSIELRHALSLTGEVKPQINDGLDFLFSSGGAAGVRLIHTGTQQAASFFKRVLSQLNPREQPPQPQPPSSLTLSS